MSTRDPRLWRHWQGPQGHRVRGCWRPVAGMSGVSPLRWAVVALGSPQDEGHVSALLEALAREEEKEEEDGGRGQEGGRLRRLLRGADLTLRTFERLRARLRPPAARGEGEERKEDGNGDVDGGGQLDDASATAVREALDAAMQSLGLHAVDWEEEVRVGMASRKRRRNLGQRAQASVVVLSDAPGGDTVLRTTWVALAVARLATPIRLECADPANVMLSVVLQSALKSLELTVRAAAHKQAEHAPPETWLGHPLSQSWFGQFNASLLPPLTFLRAVFHAECRAHTNSEDSKANRGTLFAEQVRAFATMGKSFSAGSTSLNDVQRMWVCLSVLQACLWSEVSAPISLFDAQQQPRYQMHLRRTAVALHPWASDVLASSLTAALSNALVPRDDSPGDKEEVQRKKAWHHGCIMLCTALQAAIACASQPPHRSPARRRNVLTTTDSLVDTHVLSTQVVAALAAPQVSLGRQGGEAVDLTRCLHVGWHTGMRLAARERRRAQLKKPQECPLAWGPRDGPHTVADPADALPQRRHQEADLAEMATSVVSVLSPQTGCALLRPSALRMVRFALCLMEEYKMQTHTTDGGSRCHGDGGSPPPVVSAQPPLRKNVHDRNAQDASAEHESTDLISVVSQRTPSALTRATEALQMCAATIMTAIRGFNTRPRALLVRMVVSWVSHRLHTSSIDLDVFGHLLPILLSLMDDVDDTMRLPALVALWDVIQKTPAACVLAHAPLLKEALTRSIRASMNATVVFVSLKCRTELAACEEESSDSSIAARTRIIADACRAAHRTGEVTTRVAHLAGIMDMVYLCHASGELTQLLALLVETAIASLTSSSSPERLLALRILHRSLWSNPGMVDVFAERSVSAVITAALPVAVEILIREALPSQEPTPQDSSETQALRDSLWRLPFPLGYAQCRRVLDNTLRFLAFVQLCTTSGAATLGEASLVQDCVPSSNDSNNDATTTTNDATKNNMTTNVDQLLADAETALFSDTERRGSVLTVEALRTIRAGVHAELECMSVDERKRS